MSITADGHDRANTMLEALAEGTEGNNSDKMLVCAAARAYAHTSCLYAVLSTQQPAADATPPAPPMRPAAHQRCARAELDVSDYFDADAVNEPGASTEGALSFSCIVLLATTYRAANLFVSFSRCEGLYVWIIEDFAPSAIDDPLTEPFYSGEAYVVLVRTRRLMRCVCVHVAVCVWFYTLVVRSGT